MRSSSKNLISPTTIATAIVAIVLCSSSVQAANSVKNYTLDAEVQRSTQRDVLVAATDPWHHKKSSKTIGKPTQTNQRTGGDHNAWRSNYNTRPITRGGKPGPTEDRR